MALRLSRRGWNNVLIFSILLFILVIQISQRQFLNNDEGQSLILAPEAQVLVVEMAEQQFERIGPSWRSSNPNWSQERIEAWLSLWYASYPVVEANLNVPLDQMVRLRLLAQAEPVIFLFDQERLTVQPANGDWSWQLSQSQFDAFTQVLN